MSAGLRRFTQAAGGPAAAGSVTPGAATATTATATTAPPVERCDMCGVTLSERHGHVVELDKRRLVCACRACYLLFTRPGAAGGRYRAVPDRYLRDAAHPLSAADWDSLGVPVGTAFFFTNSALGRVVGCYPSPGGATECDLTLGAWDELAGTHPLLRAAEPDVEAVFVADREAIVVPIDACYALVGAVRLHWRGLDGGDEVRRRLAAFVDDLRTRSRELEA